MNLTRREFAKANAAAIAAAAAGLPILVRASNLVTEADVTSLVWNKAPCRFCGTGCSVMVATRDGQVVATHGDIKAEVNRGINCVKGYFLSKIMYGSDRLTRPLLRMKDGKFDKQGEFQPISWEQAFDIMAEKFKAALKAKDRSRSACSAPASGRSGKAMRRTSCSRPACAATTSTPTPATAWPRR